MRVSQKGHSHFHLSPTFLPQTRSEKFIQHIRTKYEISKTSEQSQRQYNQVEETEYGEYAQVDFAEMWMQYSGGRRKEVYFFVMILCSSRKKNHTPQTLQKEFEECLDKDMYSAKDLISLCDGRGKRIPQSIDRLIDVITCHQMS